MGILSRRLATACIAFSLALPATALAQSEETWADLKLDVFGEAAIGDGEAFMTMDAPTRAQDAAMVPVEFAITLPEGDGRTIEKVTLIVDENPAPVAAAFTFGEDRRDVWLSTRLRVERYSHLRAVAETSDGELHMISRFVKASGGCAAPALKDADEALASLGQMRLRAFAPEAASEPTITPLPQAQLMIRHPNYSGLQMNQLTRLYIPAKFVSNIVVTQGDALVFEMEGGISLSEDPSIRFNYEANGEPLRVVAEDTDGTGFSGTLDPGAERSGT